MKRLLSIIIALVMLFLSVDVFAEADAQMTVENADSIDISKPCIVNITVPSDFVRAEFRLDDIKLSELESTGETEYDVELDLSEATYLGDAVLYAKIIGNTTKTIAKNVHLTKLMDSETKFSEDFEVCTDANPGGKMTVYDKSGSRAILVDHDEGKAIGITSEQITSSSPFLIKDGLGITDSFVELDFDVKFSAPSDYLTLEMRSVEAKTGNPNKYFWINGKPTPSMSLGSNGKLINKADIVADVWYSLKLKMCTFQKGMEIYLKGGDYDDYTLMNRVTTFEIDGFNQFRFVCGFTTNDGGMVCFDNIQLTKQSIAPVWYYRTAYESIRGIESDKLGVTDGIIKLNFSDDMDSLDSDKIKLTNASGDAIEYNGSYDSNSKEFSIQPINELVYGSEYFIDLEDGIISTNGKTALSSKTTTVKTEKHFDIASAQANVDSITVKFSNVNFVPDGSILMAGYYDGDMLCGINYVELSSGISEYTINLEKTSDDCELKMFLIDSFDSIKTLEAF